MNIKYCNEQCLLGKEKSKELLENHNSVYDAALDFMRFTEDCFKSCKDKESNNSYEQT